MTINVAITQSTITASVSESTVAVSVASTPINVTVSTSGASEATNVSIVDSGGFYTGVNVEVALQEIGDGTTLDARYVQVAGDTMTGALIINSTLLVNLTTTDPVSNPIILQSNPSVVLTANNSTSFAALGGNLEYNQNGFNATAANNAGVNFSAKATGDTGRITTLKGLSISSINDGLGEVQTLIGLNVDNISNPSGVIVSTMEGIRISSISNSNSNVFTYGLRIMDITAASSAALNIALQTNDGNVYFNEGGDADTDIRMETDTDAFAFYLNGGTNSLTIGSNVNLGKLGVDGNSDVKQLTIQAHSTQTANRVEIQASDGTPDSGFDKDGNLFMLETTTPTAVTNYGKIYFKADNKMYAQTGDGVEHEIAFV